MIAMRWGALSALTLWLAAPLAAVPLKPAKPTAVPKLMQSCDAHKFETVVDTMVDGQPQKSKIKLCGVEGQSDADWIKTLRDAIRKLEANKDMAPAMRAQIVTAINAEIGRLSIVGSAAATKQGSASDALSSFSLSRGHAALPPLPAPREARGTSSAPIGRDFEVLPPLPTAPAAPTVAPSTQAAASPAGAPRLSIACETPGELAEGARCAEFERETSLTVRAGEDVPAGTALQFVRNGQAQGDVPLDGLRKGDALRTALPAQVCAGFGAGRLDLRIVHDGGAAGPQVLKSDGPYALRC
jgi:hypothetical protein